MKISIGQDGDKVNFEAVDVRDIRELSELILKGPYSLGVFKENYRTKANFIQAEAIGLDFDEGMSLAEATELFKEYSHIIAPSRSHQVEKNGKVCDRFRVILILSSPITDAETFEATWFSLAKKYPKLDKACKDVSRFFYPSKSVHSLRGGGLKVEPVAPSIPEKPKLEPIDRVLNERGELGKATLKFLQFGAPHGERHRELYKAARDSNQNGYSFAEFVEWVNDLCERVGDDAYKDEGAIKAIQDAFTKEPKHEPRIEKKAFNLRSVGQLYQNDIKLEWLVDGLFYKGGLSLIVAEPKAGKSTIVRQLIRSVLAGDTFLGRKCEQGSVDYYAFEEHPYVLQKTFKIMGLTDQDKLFTHVGPAMSEDSFEEFRELVVARRPSLVVVDVMLNLLKVENEYSYQQIYAELNKLRQLSVESGSHILLVHHTSKGTGEKRRGQRAILGSQALAGGVDTIIVVERDGKDRFITTSGREVQGWEYRMLVYNPKDRTYSLGPEVEDLY